MRTRSGTLRLRSEGLGGVFVNARDRHKSCEIWPRQSGKSAPGVCSTATYVPRKGDGQDGSSIVEVPRLVVIRPGGA